jgi:outer membrane receptor for ferric coprogen and ferric-rhodotorulic acid
MRKFWLNSRGLGTTAVILASAPLTLSAQETAPQSPATTLGKITVSESQPTPYTVEDSASATRLPLTLRETPQSVTVVTRERLDDQKMQSLRDVLDETPGVYSYQWDSERVIFSSRGFTVDSLMYDGIPAVTNFSTDSVDESLDTALYDRIEIVRGATGLMTGAGSPAASVNLVRKHATSDTSQTQFDLTAASWEDRRVEGDVSTPLNRDGTVRARVVGVFQDRESYQALYRNKKKVFYAIVDADLAPSTHAALGVDYQDNDPTGVTWGSFPLYLGDGTPANWTRSVSTSTDWTFWNRRTKTAFGELSHAFGNGWSVRASLTWRKFSEDDALFYLYGFPDPETGTGLDPFAYRSRSDVTQKALDVHASGPFELFGRRHELVVGYNGSRSDYTGVEFQPGEYADPGNFFLWDGSYPAPTFAPEATPLTNIDTRQNGFYTAARLSLTDPLKLIAGARFSTFRTDYFYLYDTPVEPFKYDFDKTLPYAGLIYDISAQFSAFASFTEIFKPQRSRDIDGRFLDPIDGRSIEVGMKGEHLDGRLNTSLTMFETRQNNIATAVYDPDTGETIKLPDGTDVSRAIDGTKTRGFELEASGQLREGWNASLGWSRYQLEDANGDDVRTFIPRTLIRGFTTWNAPGALSKLTIGAGVNWQSESRTQVGAPNGGTTLRQGSVTLVSLMARYQITPEASVQVNGDNLLDKKYFVLDEFDNTYYGVPLKASVSFRLAL